MDLIVEDDDVDLGLLVLEPSGEDGDDDFLDEKNLPLNTIFGFYHLI